MLGRLPRRPWTAAGTDTATTAAFVAAPRTAVILNREEGCIGATGGDCTPAVGSVATVGWGKSARAAAERVTSGLATRAPKAEAASSPGQPIHWVGVHEPGTSGSAFRAPSAHTGIRKTRLLTIRCVRWSTRRRSSLMPVADAWDT